MSLALTEMFINTIVTQPHTAFNSKQAKVKKRYRKNNHLIITFTYLKTRLIKQTQQQTTAATSMAATTIYLATAPNKSHLAGVSSWPTTKYGRCLTTAYLQKTNGFCTTYIARANT